MRFLLALLIAILTAVAIQGPATGQGVVLANSDPVVTIHSTFTGQSITLFGNIEPGTGSVPETGPYDVVILVRGPTTDRIVRKMERQFGIMLNAEQAVYRDLPSYYAVISSRPFDQILGPGLQADRRIGLQSVVEAARTSQDGASFDPELVRIMQEAGLYAEVERGVSFLSSTLFATRIALPSSVPNGAYLAQVLIVKDGNLVGSGSTSFSVRTQGFERYLSQTASNSPLLYGLAAVLIALATGWMGGVLFRR